MGWYSARQTNLSGYKYLKKQLNKTEGREVTPDLFVLQLGSLTPNLLSLSASHRIAPKPTSHSCNVNMVIFVFHMRILTTWYFAPKVLNFYDGTTSHGRRSFL